MSPMERLEWMAHGIAPDDATLHHHGLRRAKAALPVLVVDQRQDAGIGPGGLLAIARCDDARRLD